MLRWSVGQFAGRWSIVDLPFPFAALEPVEVVRAAARILKETRCQAVKLEGGREQSQVIAALVGAGIPVMAHCGLRPQNVHLLGGYKVQREEQRLLADAQAAATAGAFAIVLECIPAGAGRQDHGGRESAHHRHRRRRRVRWPGAGHARPAGAHQRLRAAVCQSLRVSRRTSWSRPSSNTARKFGPASFPGSEHSFKG